MQTAAPFAPCILRQETLILVFDHGPGFNDVGWGLGNVFYTYFHVRTEYFHVGTYDESTHFAGDAGEEDLATGRGSTRSLGREEIRCQKSRAASRTVDIVGYGPFIQ